MTAAKLWCAGMLLLAGTVCGGVAAFNYVVDPWALNREWLIEGFNRYKPDALNMGRLTKAYAVLRERPAAAVFGTSTAEQGLSTAHPAWDGSGPAYNLSFPGATIAEMAELARHAHAVRPLKRVAVALDFFSFNAHMQVNAQMREALEAIADPLARARPYFSRGMLAASLEAAWRQPELGPYHLPSGQTDPEAFVLWKKRAQGHRNLFRFSERGLVRGLLPKPAMRYELQRGNEPSTIEQAAGLVAFARREGIEMKLFISPVHARQLEVIRALGLWTAFELWKLQLAHGVEAQRGGDPKIALWDFADYGPLNAEPVPHDAASDMRWFWDTQHYKTGLGDLVLDRVFGVRRAGAAEAAGFGQRLDPAGIGAHLLAVRERQQAYQLAHPGDVAEVREQVSHARQLLQQGGRR